MTTGYTVGPVGLQARSYVGQSCTDSLPRSACLESRRNRSLVLMAYLRVGLLVSFCYAIVFVMSVCHNALVRKWDWNLLYVLKKVWSVAWDMLRWLWMVIWKGRMAYRKFSANLRVRVAVICIYKGINNWQNYRNRRRTTKILSQDIRDSRRYPKWTILNTSLNPYRLSQLSPFNFSKKNLLHALFWSNCLLQHCFVLF